MPPPLLGVASVILAPSLFESTPFNMKLLSPLRAPFARISWLPDPRKRLEGFLRLGQGQLKNGSQIAVKLFKDNLRTIAELLDKLVGQNSVPSHFEKRLVGSRKNLRRLGADPVLEGLERILSAVVVGKVGHVLPQDHLPRPIQLRGIVLAEVGLKPLNYLRQC